MLRAAEGLLNSRYGFRDNQQRGGLHTGTHDNCSSYTCAVAKHVVSRDKGPHAVSHDDIGHIGIQCLGGLLQPVHIPHQNRSSILFTEITVLTCLSHRLSMSHVILAGDNKAFLREEFGKLFITFRIFCHAVYDLQYATNILFPIRCIPDSVKSALTVS